jgi:UDP-3-O-[3-hydroxymyristoyl] glucosamine N-acyltransferase
LVEDYIEGYLSVVCDLHVCLAPEPVDQGDQRDDGSGLGKTEFFATLVFNANTGNDRELETRDQVLVFVGNVQFVKFPEFSIPSVIRLYVNEDEIADSLKAVRHVPTFDGPSNFRPVLAKRELAVAAGSGERTDEVIPDEIKGSAEVGFLSEQASSATIPTMKLGELATRLGAELRGDAELEVTGVKGIEEAGPKEITFVANPRYAGLARKTRAAAVLVEPEFQEIAAATLRIQNPYLAFSRALGLFYQPPVYSPGIHPTAVIDPTAEIGEGAHVGAYVVVGPGVRIGPHATLLPHVVLYPGVRAGSHLFAHAHAVVREDCILGDHVTLENGAIVGADGFGFAKNEAGHWEKIPQSGPVRLGNRVDVQANACIDRATVGATEIGDGTKVDNLVQVGHGSRVGENTLLCAQTGLAGSSVVGNNVILAGQTGIAGHCSVGDGVILTAQSAVSHDVPPGKTISGSPGFDNRVWLRAVTIFQRLPELLKRLDRLEKKVAAQAAPQAAPDEGGNPE